MCLVPPEEEEEEEAKDDKASGSSWLPGSEPLGLSQILAAPTLDSTLSCSGWTCALSLWEQTPTKVTGPQN